MHGNAWEWCEDRTERLSGAPKKDNRDITDVLLVTDRTERLSGAPKKDNRDITDVLLVTNAYGRVLRGGSFNFLAVNVRCADRYGDVPTYWSYVVGFRPARTFR
jgi:formylglycine-generating enzyme required for sulfatase activity